MAKRFLQLPVLPPNGENGEYIIDCDIEGSYKESDQVFTYVYAGCISAIVPNHIKSATSCHIYLQGQVTAIYCMLSADEVAGVLKVL